MEQKACASQLQEQRAAQIMVHRTHSGALRSQEIALEDPFPVTHFLLLGSCLKVSKIFQNNFTSCGLKPPHLCPGRTLYTETSLCEKLHGALSHSDIPGCLGYDARVIRSGDNFLVYRSPNKRTQAAGTA